MNIDRRSFLGALIFAVVVGVPFLVGLTVMRDFNFILGGILMFTSFGITCFMHDIFLPPVDDEYNE